MASREIRALVLLVTDLRLAPRHPGHQNDQLDGLTSVTGLKAKPKSGHTFRRGS
jgi:hypothetical protein